MASKRDQRPGPRAPEPSPVTDPPVVTLSAACGHGCRECFIDRAAIALHFHGVIPNKAFREAARLWDARVACMKDINAHV